jgi:hypothetical protein
MKTVQILELDDCVKPNDWCRPLRLESMSGGLSDSYSFKSMYTGKPENNVKWLRVKEIFGPCWFGKQSKELMKYLPYEFVRGEPPTAHCFNNLTIYND